MDDADYAQERMQEGINESIDIARERTAGAGTLDGICEDCGEYIPAVRIMAVPWATRCVFCQEIYEESLI